MLSCAAVARKEVPQGRMSGSIHGSLNGSIHEMVSVLFGVSADRILCTSWGPDSTAVVGFMIEVIRS